MSSKILCIYHGHCADGFAAAWVVRTFYDTQPDCDVEFYPAKYDDDIPRIDPAEDRHVLIVDFSYPVEQMERLALVASSVTVLDHHKTAQAALEPLLANGTIQGEFDMTRSGAMMTWNHFFPGEDPPALLTHVQDRDLWEFNYHNTRAIMAAVFSYDFTFENWDGLMSELPSRLEREGLAIDRANLKMIRDHIKLNAYSAIIGYVRVPVVNCPGAWASDAGHIMGANQPFAASYTEVDGYRKYSLRSQPGCMDVSKIAEQYGGGGHKHAAGFTVAASRMR